MRLSIKALAVLAGLIFISALPAAARGVPEGFAELNTRLSPAVVNISTSQNVEIEDEVPAFPEGSPLERFNDFFNRRNNNSGRVSKSLGSGFVIDAAGHIVTNNHVIEEADVIEVTFPNGDTYTAELLGRDPSTDLALLKIDAGKDIPFVSFGNSDTAEVGEWVIAIGNPFGYGGSVAAGIISARNRQINHGNYDDFLQTDVAINRGNSGGPLFNMQGEVIGVNTAILSPTGYSVGISFSIPSDLAQSVIRQLREYGETRRGSLGVSVQEVDKDLAKSVRLDAPTGAIVTRVVKDSPAAKAGIKVSDIILQIDGETVPDQRSLYRMVAESKIGVPLDVTVLRKRKRKTVSVTMERLKEKVTKDDLARLEKDEQEADRVAMGISIEALTDGVRRKHKILPSVKGVRVVKVSTRSEAAGKILSGDIIEEVSFEPVEMPEAFEEAVTAAKDSGRPITILVNRGGNYVFYSMNVS